MQTQSLYPNKFQKSNFKIQSSSFWKLIFAFCDFYKRILLLIGLICSAAFVRAGDGGGIVARAVLDGTQNQVQKDSSRTVEDSAFFNASVSGVDTGYSVQNLVTVKINEASPLYLRTSFTATVLLHISYSNGTDTASMNREFTINYDSAHSYNARNGFMFYGGRRVTVKILSVTSNASWDVSSVLMVENQLTAKPKYIFSCSTTVSNITVAPSADPAADELPVTWTAVRGADQYDVEWCYIDSSALANNKYGNPLNPALVFYHNATRISTTGNSYNIPLIYDNTGTLFIRVRPVQIGRANSVIAAIWSSDASPAVMGQYQFTGHERPLNWQSNISFAEEGKRKVVVQYFDGSLRSRQTITKDNTTNKTIVAETFYDYQGRPAIQVMPAPSLKNIIQYTAGFNVSINNAEYTQSNFDSLYSPDMYCNAHADPMSSDSGSSQYYSPNNPNKTIGMNQFIPDAQNYPFTETEYTQDNTGRISRQGGVGPNHRIGSGHETQYFYGTPDQNEIDALFGTDVGDHSHYFKNMVRDANGQYSVSYVDMHGRTIATALAGNAPSGIAPLPSNALTTITENLADSGSRFLQNWSLVNQKSLVVASADNYNFSYHLDPSSITEQNCSAQNICYTCLYDLEITVTDNCNNQLLPGNKAFDTVVHNFSFGAINGSCSPASMNLNFSLFLKEGSYQVTKQLTVNRDAYVFYRDSIYMPNNTCKSMQDFISDQKAIIAASTSQCVPDCQTCRTNVGTYDHFKNDFIAKAGISPQDTATYSTQIQTAYNSAIEACNVLCGDSASSDNDIRSAMLQDVTPPFGQYADTTKFRTDKYSVFYIDPKDSLSYVPVYRLDNVNYLDENGQPDKVYNLASNLMVDPRTLSMSEFTQNFRASWAEALLPYHPEYCKLQALESLKASNVYDRQMEAIDNYHDALAAGYLNPTGNRSLKYTVNNIDPFITLRPDKKSTLETKMQSYISFGRGNPSLSMWGMATSMVKCDSGNAQCIRTYTDESRNFDTTAMCDGDLDMAWLNFRQLYLTAKQDIENDIVNNPVNCTPLNPAYTKIPANSDLDTLNHVPEFNESTQTVLKAQGLDFATNPNNAAQAVAGTQKQLNDYYDSTVEQMSRQWTAQLAPCSYTNADLNDSILPKLKGLCLLACDIDHPFGASSLPAGTNYQGYTSFQQIINTYNQIHHIDDALHCNAELITTPAPYDKQPVYFNKPVYTTPSDCECKLITDLYVKYRLANNAFVHHDASFAAYMQRTQGVTMTDNDLSTLLNLCHNKPISGPAGFSCVYLKQPIFLPPAMQCNSGSSCASCTMVNNLYQGYLQQYPSDTPRIAEADDTIQVQKNTLFRNYMNNRLGYSYEAADYLQFIKQCADSAANITDITQCVDGHVGNLFMSLGTGKLLDVQHTPDGGYIMAGNTGLDATLIKADSLGIIQWSKKYGGNSSDSFVRVRRTSDNGYIAIGTTKSAHYATGSIWIVKTDGGGTVTWSKSIGFNTPFGERGYDVIQTADGGYAALGIYNQHTGNGEFVLTSLQSDGTINWTHRFGNSRIQNNSYDCLTPQTDSLTYDGSPSYGLLQQDDTLLVTGAAYDRNLGNRYYGVVYRVNRNDGSLLGSWHYADNTSSTKSVWFRDIYATPNGYMITANTAEQLGTSNAQAAVINISKTGDVLNYQYFNIPAGSSKMTTSAIFPALGGGYVVAQTGDNGTHIDWQRIDASGAVAWANETSLPGTQTIGRIIQNNDSSFTAVGDNNQQMLMLVLRHSNTCYNDDITLGTSSASLGMVNWAAETNQFVTPLYTDTSLATIAYVITDSTITCSGNGTCYDIYDGPLLCGKSQPVLPPVDMTYTGVCADSTFFAVSKGTELYKAYNDSLTGDFEQRYTNTCLQAYRYESFTVTHHKQEYHYTLYYYDQAGNLIRTVSPAGVKPITDSVVLQQVKAARLAGTVLVPQHTLVTDYRYNTLNQVVAQHSPDGGTSHFWYDRLGRLSVSQNAKQASPPTGGAGGSLQYSYTKYDVIGRITEVGQLRSSDSITDGISRTEATLTQWLNNAAGTADQITKTNYDFEYTPLEPVLTARNLRNRVSWTALYNTAADLANNTAATASFYTYDILGNVDTLVQDYKLGTMANNNNRFKKIVYDFDLVSGKVNQVSYQPGQPDAFYHRYIYDAENRITNVLTSADSLNWDNDAFYMYYDHGPLARTILGEQQVQGINYAYNLQGWMKSINPDIYNGTGYTLKADGSNGSVVGKTAYNIMLNYFNGDYRAISGATPMDTLVNNALGGDYRPLYNGNISSMAVNVNALNNPLLYNYQYDQLNRLVAMDAWNKTGSAWSNISKLSDFQERVNYDPNGNILGYKRNGNNTFAGKPLGMDSLTYSYVMGTNRLDHVNDSVPAANYDVDIDNQSAGNYSYDSIGNITKDNAEGITNISWTVYGKISQITKNNGTTITYTYDASGNRISKVITKSSPASSDTTWYVRDAQGNVMSVYAQGIDSVNSGHLTQTELHLYGSSRLGILRTSVDVASAPNNTEITMPLLNKGDALTFARGNKLFELSNHLGNVLVTISDKKLGYSSNDSTVDYFNPQVVSAQDYYPFGMLQPGREFNVSGYRYGFNGKENDNEVKGEGNELDYGMRVYDPRLGRFLSVDPLINKYPWYTPYQFAGNKPTRFVDLDGLEEAESLWTRIGKEGFSALLYASWDDYKNVGYEAVDGVNRNVNPLGIVAHGAYGTVFGEDLVTHKPKDRLTAFTNMGVNIVMIASGEKLATGLGTTTQLEKQIVQNTVKGQPSALSSSTSSAINTESSLLINGIRNLLSKKGFTLALSRNVAYVEGTIAGQKVAGAAVSGELERLGSGLIEMPQNRFFTTFTIRHSRAYDSEVKIFETLANQFNKGSAEANRKVFGEINIVSENPVCGSCSGVMDQFKLMFPNIHISYNNGVQATKVTAK
jgi:RHS repeat-associated protein